MWYSLIHSTILSLCSLINHFSSLRQNNYDFSIIKKLLIQFINKHFLNDNFSLGENLEIWKHRLFLLPCLPNSNTYNFILWSRYNTYHNIVAFSSNFCTTDMFHKILHSCKSLSNRLWVGLFHLKLWSFNLLNFFVNLFSNSFF